MSIQEPNESIGAYDEDPGLLTAIALGQATSEECELMDTVKRKITTGLIQYPATTPPQDPLRIE